MNNLSNSGGGSSNTDGANTIYSSNIQFIRWSVTNGDDSISIKANSTNIVVRDSNFYTGNGLAFGSIGQYKGAFETIENVFVTNITCHKTTHAVYFKTWTGEQVGYPPNGGGGGFGCMDSPSSLSSIIHPTSVMGSTVVCVKACIVTIYEVGYSKCRLEPW